MVALNVWKHRTLFSKGCIELTLRSDGLSSSHGPPVISVDRRCWQGCCVYMSLQDRLSSLTHSFEETIVYIYISSTELNSNSCWALNSGTKCLLFQPCPISSSKSQNKNLPVREAVRFQRPFLVGETTLLARVAGREWALARKDLWWLAGISLRLR